MLAGIKRRLTALKDARPVGLRLVVVEPEELPASGPASTGDDPGVLRIVTGVPRAKAAAGVGVWS